MYNEITVFREPKIEQDISMALLRIALYGSDIKKIRVNLKVG